MQDGFISALKTLARSISLTALPASSSAPHSFSAYSFTADNSISLRPGPGGKSDLSTWREIFRIYAEAEVFESVRESTRGERSIEEVHKQLKLFEGLVQEKQASLTLPGSREAFDVFLNLNSFILDVKKVTNAPRLVSRFVAPAHQVNYSSNSRIQKRLERSSRNTPNVRHFLFRPMFWNEARLHPRRPHVKSR